MSSVFAKKQINTSIIKLDIDLIKNTIPANASKTYDAQLARNHTETRWRILNINNKNYIEISRKKPSNSTREYVTHDMQWGIRDIGDEYDNNVIEQYYYYSYD